MNFVADVVQTQAPQFMDLGLSPINTLNENDVPSTPANRILWLTYGSHWSAPDHVFGEATSIVTSASNSDHNYKYKNDFLIWRKK